MPEVMREIFEKRAAVNKEGPQQSSSQERNYWSDTKAKTCGRAEFFARQTDVRVEISSRTFLCQLSLSLQKNNEERCSLHVSNKFCSE